MSGAVSGSIAMAAIYPLENIRTRLSLQSNKEHYNGIVDVFKKTKIKSTPSEKESPIIEINNQEEE